MTMERKVTRRENPVWKIVCIGCAGCLVFAIMQGVHDNYGIMMHALVPVTGISYVKISFIIGIGAILYGLTQPFWGILALKRSGTFVMLLGASMMAAGLIVSPLCRHFFFLLLFFGIILPAGTAFWKLYSPVDH